MTRFTALFLLLILPFSTPAPGADADHIKSAFAFAHKRMWTMAMQEAQAGHSRILTKYFTWLYLKDPGSDADFDSIAAFVEENPEWPDKQALLKHAEVALLAGNPSDETLNAWFSEHPPQTTLARRLGARDENELNALIRDAWVADDYDKDTEAKLLLKYRDILTQADHVRRIDRLLWEGKTDEAKRLVKYVPYGYQRLFATRIALAQDKQVADVDLVNVQPTLRKDPGLLFERLRWRMRRGDKDGVRELLLAAPAEIPYPEKWWPLRDRQIREALGEGNVKLAEQLLARHGQPKDSNGYKEAQWLSAWITLEYRHADDKAYPVFVKLFRENQTPGSKARAAYWAGRAASKGEKLRWYAQAAHYATTFYGQLALLETSRDPELSIDSEDEPSTAEKAHFRKREVVQLVYALGAAHETDMAGKFILYLVDDAGSPGEAVLAARLGREINRIDYGVRASKKILQSDIVSLPSGWPVIRVTSAPGIEPPLVLGLCRQESEFYADAISGSGAIGLMQLLPSTAKEIARKNGIGYSADRLFEPNYNITLGGLYFHKLLDKFNGSYVLSIASYNAGPGRVGHWVDEYGRPGGDLHAAIDWIERIPTPETRNYVQHVLENTEVYRYELARKDSIRLGLGEDLLR